MVFFVSSFCALCVCFFISVYVAFTTYLLSLSSRPYWPQYSLIPLVPGWRFFNESFGALEIYNTSCSQPSCFAAGLANLLLLLLLLSLSDTQLSVYLDYIDKPRASLSLLFQTCKSTAGWLICGRRLKSSVAVFGTVAADTGFI